MDDLISPESGDLISRLLVADPRYRLLGAVAAMPHPFFAPIDFQRRALSARHVRWRAASQNLHMSTCHMVGSLNASQ